MTANKNVAANEFLRESRMPQPLISLRWTVLKTCVADFATKCGAIIFVNAWHLEAVLSVPAHAIISDETRRGLLATSGAARDLISLCLRSNEVESPNATLMCSSL